jgi:2-polyprenyl-3-methyl-5-hydroxy-6-metoxy-1,4-benzoquinol methylase
MPGFAAASLRIYNQLASRIVPGHRHTQMAYHEWLLSLLSNRCDWLDLGCGHQVFPSWVDADAQGMIASCHKAVGIDLDFPSLRKNLYLRDRVMGSLEHLPFSSASFDVVTCNWVVEHLESPATVLAEITRVLRPGGRFLFHTPNRNAPALRVAAHTPERLKAPLIWILEQRPAEDVFRTYYRMNTEEDIHRLAAGAGLEVERLEQLSSAAMTAILGPLAIPELLFMRMLRSERHRGLRSSILAVLRK